LSVALNVRVRRFPDFYRKSLDGISQVQLKESFPRLHDDLVKLAYASYVAELVSEMTEEGDGDQTVFDMLLAYMRVLSETPIRAGHCRV